MTLEEEQERAEKLLKGRTISKIWRHRPNEVVIQFEDGGRLFVDADTPLELSVTDMGENDD